MQAILWRDPGVRLTWQRALPGKQSTRPSRPIRRLRPASLSRRFSLEVPPCWRKPSLARSTPATNCFFLLGLRRSQRPPDPLHPFGHEQGDLLLFPPGRGLYFRPGRATQCLPRDLALRHPQPSPHLGWNYALLALAAAFELYSRCISYRELLLSKDPDKTTWQVPKTLMRGL
jgi:hypothetical protein